MKKIPDIRPYRFYDMLIIGLAENWIDIFEKVPTFSVRLNSKRKLVLTSIEEVKNIGGKNERSN